MPYADPENARNYQRAYMRSRREAFRKIVEDAKRVPCADCGVKYPTYVMQFDHVRGEKLFHLASATTGSYSQRSIEEEIAKCEVVCANCHAERTEKRRQASGANLRGVYKV